ncbi:LOW QUALITY PROTEIN: DNA-binding response regulator [Bacillus sp. JCM 19046]|nr:LOW QUALITY PROTEIN: DNA-binding response regulator [Bacillus sp. JCM 19046]
MTILLIEDDPSIAQIVTDYLEKESFTIMWCEDGEIGYNTFLTNTYDLIVVDLMLPKMDGFTLCEKIREHSDVPIIVVSAKQSDFDKVRSLEIGADDYVTKPFSPFELTARVKAQIRRYKRGAQPQAEYMFFKDVKIDRKGRRVIVDGEAIVLTAKEYQLFLYLAENPGQVFSKEDLYTEIWNGDGFDSRTVTVHIKNLRYKLKDGKKLPKYIETVWGVGYKFIGIPGK